MRLLTLSEFHLLTEDRIGTLTAMYGQKLVKFWHNGLRVPFPAEQIVHVIASYDPSRNKMYTQWLIGQCLLPSNHRTVEDFHAISVDLTDFDRVKPAMPVNMRDINHFKTYHDLRVAIQPFLNHVSAKELDKRELDRIKQDVKVLYDGPDGKILIPKTMEASCFLGRGTKWCTAAEKDNYFETYNRMGELIVFITPDGKKWQLHIESTQFMNDQDLSVNLKNWITTTSYAKLFQHFAATRTFSKCFVGKFAAQNIGVLSKFADKEQLKRFISNFPRMVSAIDISRRDDIVSAVSELTQIEILEIVRSNNTWDHQFFPLHASLIPLLNENHFVDMCRVYNIKTKLSYLEVYLNQNNYNDPRLQSLALINEIIGYVPQYIPVALGLLPTVKFNLIKKFLSVIVNTALKALSAMNERDIVYPARLVPVVKVLDLKIPDRLAKLWGNSFQQHLKSLDITTKPADNYDVSNSSTLKLLNHIFPGGVLKLNGNYSVYFIFDLLPVQSPSDINRAMIVIDKKINDSLKQFDMKQTTIINYDENMEYLLKALKSRNVDSLLLKRNIGQTYHKLNDALSGKQGHDLLKQFDVTTFDLAQLMQKVLELATPN